MQTTQYSDRVDMADANNPSDLAFSGQLHSQQTDSNMNDTFGNTATFTDYSSPWVSSHSSMPASPEYIMQRDAIAQQQKISDSLDYPDHHSIPPHLQYHQPTPQHYTTTATDLRYAQAGGDYVYYADTHSQQCRICHDRATGRHYGAVSCDGCKGFFRRSVRKDRQYKCRFNDQCVIDKDHRNSCRACRYRKCVQAGMKDEFVQYERDRTYVDGSGSRQANNDNNTTTTVVSATTPTQTTTATTTVNNNTKPATSTTTNRNNSFPGDAKSQTIFENVNRNLNAMNLLGAPRSHQSGSFSVPSVLEMLLRAEQVTHKSVTGEPTSIKDDTRDVSNVQYIKGWPVADIRDVTESMRRQLLLMVEWAKSLEPFINIDTEDQIRLLRNYSAQHILICCAYRSHVRSVSDLVLLFNGTVLTRDARDVHDINNVTRRILDELLAPINELNVSEQEYVALKGITLFNPRLPALRSAQIVERTRQQILDSLEDHVQQRPMGRTPATRMANVLLILPSLRAIADGMLEDLNMVKLFGLAEIDSLLEDLLPISNQTSGIPAPESLSSRGNTQSQNINKRRFLDDAVKYSTAL